jgi:predicted transcriptional regulator
MKDKLERRNSINSRIGVVSGIGKVISAPKRLNILVGLMDDSKAFQQIKTITGLEKSALSNHLKLLTQQGLVEKKHHGVYSITYQGYQLMIKLDDLIDETVDHLRNERELEIRRKFTDSFLNRPKY